MTRALLSGITMGVYKYPKVAIEGYKTKVVKDPEKRATMYEMLDKFLTEGFLEGPRSQLSTVKHSLV